MIRTPVKVEVGSADPLHFKDEILDRLAATANVAQFISFAPGVNCVQRFSRVHGYSANHRFNGVDASIVALLEKSPDKSVNVRSFRPEKAKGGAFLYGLKDVETVVREVRRLASEGTYTIVNETIDVMDGGVSGVAVGAMIEFAPHDTPRCVEKPGTCRFSREMGLSILSRVYGFPPALDYAPQIRVEFSLHPLCRGVRREHTVIWEIEDVGATYPMAEVVWPNRFSQFLGDKAFGLLVADALGLSVPLTTVIPRLNAPFSFGRSTGTSEPWIRTCPITQEPGRFTTRRGWVDPFQLLNEEDQFDAKTNPKGRPRIASILAQEGVGAAFSGALISSEDGEVIVEGVLGYGDEFMKGTVGPQVLPAEVHAAVMKVYEGARKSLGPVRIEWVYDGTKVWVVQLHRGPVDTIADTIVPGEVDVFQEFEVKQGLEALRALIPEVQASRNGIVLIGDVGITSHFGDLLRRAKIPARLVRRKPQGAS